MFPDSKFHCGLHKWIQANQGKPLFHIDVHGKINRKENCDIDLGTYNISIKDLENAVTDKTKAIILAHTLGNPFNLDAIMNLKERIGESFEVELFRKERKNLYENIFNKSNSYDVFGILFEKTTIMP